MGAPDFPITASMQDQLREYYSRKILTVFPEKINDPEIQFGNVYEMFIRYVNEGLLPDYAVRDDLFVNAKDYGVVGDGVTDDSASLLVAANRAVTLGIPLNLSRTKTYKVANFVFPANLTLKTNGAKFVKTVNNSTYAIKTSDNFTCDKLKLEITGGGSSDAGININGNNTVIDSIEVTSLTADQLGPNALLVGDLAVQKSNIRINEITLTAFRSPMRVINVIDSQLSNAKISNFLTGVYVVNTINTNFDKFKVTGTSPSSNGTAGQNGLLLEAQNVDFGCQNLRFRDWVIDGSPEHNYRIGGGLTVADITFEDCISRNPGNAPGNVATGGGAFKVLGANGHLHKNIQYINCSAEDGNTSASGINNHSQFSIGFVDGVTLINPRLKAVNKTYSGQNGIILFACKNVTIEIPSFESVLRNSVLMTKDPSEPSPPIGVTNVRITGGYLDSSGVQDVIKFDPLSVPIKDVFINTTASRGLSSLAWLAPTTVGSDTGSYTNVEAWIRYVNSPGASVPPINSDAAGDLVTVNYVGAIYGSTVIKSKDGGFYTNTGDGKRYIRKAAAWVQL